MISNEDFLYKTLIGFNAEFLTGDCKLNGEIIFETQNLIMIKDRNDSIKKILKSSINDLYLIFEEKKVLYNHSPLLSSTLISRIKKIK